LAGNKILDAMSLTYEVGDWVEVRSREEILSTLDEKGRLDNMPFMPEMLQYCGKRFRVSKRAHKTCDTVHGTGGRRVEDCIHLEGLRCDGTAHGGCDAACFLFWKTAWVKPVERSVRERSRHPDPSANNDGFDEEDLHVETRTSDGEAYKCQATELPKATEPLQWWEASQYIEDYRSGNVGLWRLIRDPLYFLYCWLTRKQMIGPLLKWINDRFRFLFGGLPYPLARGEIPRGERTPVAHLNLQPGEMVRVKSFDEIRSTLNEFNKNRGMSFDKEQVPYCGGMYRVRHRVERIINEETGEMMEMKTPAVILEGVTCRSRFSECRLFCPRDIYSMWRETWLERVDPSAIDSSEDVMKDIPVL
jgi:hypothetical protein